MMRFHKTPCPVCGNASVYATTASATGAVDQQTGKPVKVGDELDRCDSCGAVTVKTKPKPAAKPTPKAKPKPKAKPAAKRKPAGKPKPAAKPGSRRAKPNPTITPFGSSSGFETPADQ